MILVDQRLTSVNRIALGISEGSKGHLIQMHFSSHPVIIDGSHSRRSANSLLLSGVHHPEGHLALFFICGLRGVGNDCGRCAESQARHGLQRSRSRRRRCCLLRICKKLSATFGFGHRPGSPLGVTRTPDGATTDDLYSRV